MEKTKEMFKLFLCFCFCFCFLPFTFSQLSTNQTNTMLTLSRLVNNSVWSFSTDQNPCSWGGVVCNSPANTSITHLSVSGFGLTSSDFLPTLCKIESLQSIDVSDNHLISIPDGFITDCGKLSGLRLLNVSKNRLDNSLPHFKGFVGLEVLDMSYNLLNGSVGLEFAELIRLKSLNLSFNRITGSIPTLLGKSKSLQELELFRNSFNGKIPEEITSYVNLTLIDFGDNQLNGFIPFSIGSLSKLEILILSNNSLSGEIPSAISSIRTLRRFAANQNSFGGSIPDGITNYLSVLDLSYNKLNGWIPANLLSTSALISLDLSYNLLNGSIPKTISPSLVRLRLGSNRLSGVIPSSTFAKTPNLTYLELNNNSLSGFIPTEIGFCKSLALLDLSQNNISGVLVKEVGNLVNLQVMKLQINKLTGEIPVTVTNLSHLSILNISWNSLTGAIPSSLSNLHNLVNLDLHGNKLSGSIPEGIRDINNLLELQLGQNLLDGRIPEMPPNLQISLNLSYNRFKGSIPKTLSQLGSLEVLDLSNNEFSGEIPYFLTQLQSLTQLILSNNQLFGVIPKFKDHVVLSRDGNQGLVNPTSTSNNSNNLSTNRKSVVSVILIVCAVVVFAVGVVSIVTYLISRRLNRVRASEDREIIQSNLLTGNPIHKSSIDFAKAMSSVADPANMVVKTRFSTYYKATMPSGTSYFVKKLNLTDKLFQYGKNHTQFENELESLGKLSNSNVMTPLAYVLTVNNAYLLYEFAEKGRLFDVLHGSSGSGLDWGSRYSIAIGLAQGIAFLHGCHSHSSGPILLLDLSSRNIMLKSLKEALVGDIELCKVIDPTKNTGSLSMVAGSVGYIPPEYAYTMRVTSATNIYSFGVVLLELLTRKHAVSEGTELAKWVLNYSKKHQQHNWEDHVLDFSISRTSVAVRSQMIVVLKVALACIDPAPEARPKMKSVVRMLVTAK